MHTLYTLNRQRFCHCSTVQFTREAVRTVIKMLDGSTKQATYKQIAERLNDPNAPAYKVNEVERPYHARDIRTLVNKLFPKALDVQQMIAHLNNLK